MHIKKTNCIIAQSGGPTSVINASLSGIIKTALKQADIDKIYGAINGIQGVIEDNIIELNVTFKNNINLIEILKTTPSMYLGSCRYKLPKAITNSTQYERIFEVFKKYNIKYFFYIGGNDSMDTVAKLNSYSLKNNYDIKIIGIPKTIDNDLFGTDHTPGFGSAAKYIATTMLEIAHDTYIYDIPSITLVEIMGRNAGWLTAASALARNSYNTSPDLIYLPEASFSFPQFINDIKTIQKNKKNVIIAVSEGIKDEKGQYITSSNTSSTNDLFGHSKLGGTGKLLEHMIQQSIDCKIRSIELNVLQRSAVHIASLTDINEAFLVGEKAVHLALSGDTGKMMTIIRKNNNPYSIEIESIEIESVANKEKLIPREWINKNGNDITNQLLDYMTPLIVGEPNITYENGLPKYLPIKHLIT